MLAYTSPGSATKVDMYYGDNLKAKACFASDSDGDGCGSTKREWSRGDVLGYWWGGAPFGTVADAGYGDYNRIYVRIRPVFVDQYPRPRRNLPSRTTRLRGISTSVARGVAATRPYGYPRRLARSPRYDNGPGEVYYLQGGRGRRPTR